MNDSQDRNKKTSELQKRIDFLRNIAKKYNH